MEFIQQYSAFISQILTIWVVLFLDGLFYKPIEHHGVKIPILDKLFVTKEKAFLAFLGAPLLSSLIAWYVNIQIASSILTWDLNTLGFCIAAIWILLWFFRFRPIYKT